MLIKIMNFQNHCAYIYKIIFIVISILLLERQFWLNSTIVSFCCSPSCLQFPHSLTVLVFSFFCSLLLTCDWFCLVTVNLFPVHFARACRSVSESRPIMYCVWCNIALVSLFIPLPTLYSFLLPLSQRSVRSLRWYSV